MEGNRITILLMCGMCALSLCVNAQRTPHSEPFVVDTLMAHDPVMAFEDGTYYLYATGHGISMATSKDRNTWTVYPKDVLERVPQWTFDSVPDFKGHIWAPDVIRWHDKWWMMYSCSSFGVNTSAIGVMSNVTLNPQADDYHWQDHGPVVVSHKQDNWNAIDPNIVIDDNDKPWVVWGSFWDGIQMAPLDDTMHILSGYKPQTIARRYAPGCEPDEPNPTSKFAGPNAIEAPFIFKHNGMYYLFVAWDYCCRGSLSNYRVAVGRSLSVSGPYQDRSGKDMRLGGGEIFIEGDKTEFEALGHCSVYNFNGEDWFFCHGYSVSKNGAPLLVQRKVAWTADGWPVVANQ